MAKLQTLHDILSAAGLKPKSTRPGTNTKMLCPECGGGSTREFSLSLTIDPDGQGFVAKCHRGSCGWTIGNKTHDGYPAKGSPVRYHPPAHHEPARVMLNKDLYGLFEKRKISPETVDAFGCYIFAGHKFPGEMGIHDALVFPYRHHGEVVNRKYRAVQSKEITGQDYNARPTLFNIDAVTSPDIVIWVEGEPDVMALHEAGYPQVVTLKDGSGDKLHDEDDPRRLTDKRFAALNTHGEFLGTVQKFVLAGDMDRPGAVLREELARRLGRHRCWTVDWPEGCKDAGDVLRLRGADAVRQHIESASPYPIEGVQEVDGVMLDRYLEMPAPPTMTTGVKEVDDIIRIPGEGRVIIITGMPNAGKTPWAVNVMVHEMKKYHRKFLVFSPEMQPLEEYLVMVSEVLVGKPARKTRGREGVALMSRQERVEAGEWLKSRMIFLSSDAEDHIPSLDWILEKARDCVMRFGITDLVIDPFNELEQAVGKEMTETQFIGQCLQRANAFALRHGCNMWIICHPAKPPAPMPGKAVPVPNGYSISGSSHWFNKATLGITVHRPDEKTQIHCWKAKFKRLGRKGGMAEIDYDMDTGRYVSPPDPAASDLYERASRGD